MLSIFNSFFVLFSKSSVHIFFFPVNFLIRKKLSILLRKKNRTKILLTLRELTSSFHFVTSQRISCSRASKLLPALRPPGTAVFLLFV